MFRSKCALYKCLISNCWRLDMKAVCPKCKKPGYGIYVRWAKDRKHRYYYFQHYEKGRIRWCYIPRKIAEQLIEEKKLPIIIEKIKNELHKKVGTIKYKCECGKITEYLDLILTGGKCPKCGTVLLKFSCCLT